LAFIKKNKLEGKATLFIGSGCYKAVNALKGLERPVMINSRAMIDTERDRITLEEKDTFVPGVLHKKGIPFAIVDVVEPWQAAARLIRNGIPRQTALEALTINAAKAIGLGHRVGSIEVGKDANLLILTGDPVDMMTWVDAAYIEGRRVYERSRDLRLRDLLKGVYETAADEKKAAADKKKSEEKTAKKAEPAKKTEAGKSKGASKGAEKGQSK